MFCPHWECYLNLTLKYGAGNTKGSPHCTVGLLFDWFGISCMTADNFCFYLQNRLIQTSQTGGQRYSDTSPFSIPCFIPCHGLTQVNLRLGIISHYNTQKTLQFYSIWQWHLQQQHLKLSLQQSWPKCYLFHYSRRQLQLSLLQFYATATNSLAAATFFSRALSTCNLFWYSHKQFQLSLLQF